MSRWVCQALLANTDLIKLGFVSRINAKVNTAHAILGVETVKPVDFVKQFQINVGNMWSVLKMLIESIQKHEGDGKFLIVKLPNKQELQIFSIPENEFEREEEEEEEDLGEEDFEAENESSLVSGQSDEIDL